MPFLTNPETMINTMKKLTHIIPILLLALSTIQPASVRAEKMDLTYRLKWLFNASVAGDIYADTYGYFEKQGLNVNVKEGGPEKNAIKELELGQAQFGVASADQVIRAREKGAKVVVLAQVFQINPMQWIYRTNLPKITSLKQLAKKSIGITFGGNDESIMNTLLTKGGLTTKDVHIKSARFDFSPFLTGKVEIWPVYRNSQGVILKDKLQQAGEDVRFLNPADFGVNFVANSIITSEKMLREHPDTVDAFLAALLQAWSDCMKPENEEKTLSAIAKKDKNTKPGIQRLQLQATRELVAAENFGTIDTEAWIQTEKIMLEESQIKKPVTVQAYLISR